MKKKVNVRHGPIFLALLLACGPVAGQQLTKLETVTNRVRPALDPLGIRVGSYLVSPSLGAEAGFNDNIFADPLVTVEDYIYLATPALSVESDWNNHYLNMEADAEIGRYDDNDKEDFDDFTIRADGRLDIHRGSYLSGEFEYSQNHEERTSAENIAGTDVLIYAVNEASLSFFRRPNRFFLRLDALFRDTDFEDTKAGDLVIDNDDRNRELMEQAIYVGYEFVPGSTLYLRGTANSLTYEQRIDRDGFERSSQGYEVVLGMTRAISGVSSASAFAGFLSQDIDDPRFETVQGVSFGADITWNITNLITLNGEGRRTIEPTSIFGASSVAVTSYSLSVDYELLRSVIVSADIELSTDDYQGLEREDEVFGAGIGLKFMLNRTLYVYLGFDYAERDVRPREFSDDTYEINTAFFRIQGQM